MAGKLVGRSISNTANVTIQSITVGNSSSNTTANSTAVAIGNVVFTDSRISVGNSTVNAAINSTSVYTLSVTVGSNVTVNTSAIFIGNSTVNTTITAGNVHLQGTQLTVGNVVVNGNQLVVGNVTITDTQITVGNSTVNTVIGQTGSLSGNGALLTSVNASSISSGTLDTARLPATVNVSTAINVGANVNVTTSSITVGNSTVNSAITSTSLDVDGTINVGNTTITGDLVVSGNVFFNGATTNVNSTNLLVEDKNIILGDVVTPSDVTADGGGITLKGATDKTLNWVDATDAWTSSEEFNLVSGKSYRINGTAVVNSSSLGTGITGSSLTSVGTLTTLAAGNTTITGFANVTSSIQGGAGLIVAGAVSGITTLAAGNTTITGFANVTSTIQGGAGLIVAGAASGITTAAMGNTTITGFISVSTNTATFGTAAYVVANGNVGIGTSAPFGKLSVLSTTGAGSTVAAWSAGHSIFGPNVGSGTGAALGLAYNTTDDRSEILSLAPNVAWKPLYLYSTGLQIFAQSASFSAIFAANGNVGISTTSPVAMLHVKGSGTSGQVTSTFILENSSSGTAGMDITGSAGASRLRFLYGGGPSTGTNTLTQAMCILTEGASAGNLGVGTSTPAYKMEVSGTLGVSGATTLSSTLAVTGNVGIGGTPSYKFHIMGGQYYIAPSGTYTSYTGDGLWGTTATPSLLGSNGQGGSYSRFGAPGMIIGYQDNGNGLYSPAYGFEVKSIDGRPVGSISVKAIVLKDIDTNTLVFYVNTTGNVLNVNNSYGSASDVSIKENITDASSKLNDLLNVRVRNYNLKADPNKLKQLGVIAQELETVFPGIVETDTEGLKSVKYSIFVPMLIKAIQEQQVLIQEQQALIQSLTTRLTAVEAR